MDCLNRLRHNIEIKAKPTPDPGGHLVLAIA